MADSGNPGTPEHGAQGHAAPSLKPPPPAERADNIQRIVEEIRDGLAAISARELELRQRERDVGQQYDDLRRSARRAASDEYDHFQQRLTQQATELNAQAVDIASRRARLAQLADQLRARQLELEQQRADVAVQVQRNRQRAAELKAWESEQTAILEQRVAAVRKQEEELRRRMALAHADIKAQREELTRLKAELDVRAEVTAEQEHEVARQRTALEARLSDGEVLVAEFAEQRETLDSHSAVVAREKEELAEAHRQLEQEGKRVAHEWQVLDSATRELEVERKRLADERQAVEQLRGALESQRAALDVQSQRAAQEKQELHAAAESIQTDREHIRTRQRELDQQFRTTHEQSDRVSRAGEEIESRRRVLTRELAEFEQRARRLDERETQLTGKAAELDAERHALVSRQQSAEQQQAVLDETLQRAQQIEQTLRHRREEFEALREQVEARDQETRQAALALEVGREELERARYSHVAIEENLQRRQNELDERVAQARGEWTQRVRALQAAEQTSRVLPRRWALRVVVLAGVVGGLCALAWLVAHPARFRAAVPLRVIAASGVSPEILSAHQRDLHALDLPFASNSTVSRDVAVAGTAGEPTLRLTIIGTDAIELRTIATTLAQTYAQQVQQRQEDPPLPPAYHDLVARRVRLVATLDELHRSPSASASTAPAEQARQRDEVAAHADRLEARLGELGGALDALRVELAAAVASDVPRGLVTADEVDHALQRDALYLEDRDEFRATALEYRTELTIALLQVTDPAKALAAALDELSDVLDEQRGLDPPASVAAVLEESAGAAGDLEAALAPFREELRVRIETVQHMDVRDDVVTLVEQQGTASDAARRLADGTVALVDTLGAKIEQLTSSSGGTREVVVGAVLRGQHTALMAASETFLAAAAKLAPTDNFELDSLDRKLRGLRMRVAGRRETVQQQLQAAADQAAHAAHGAAIGETRRRLRDLEAEREQIASGLVATLQQLRTLDEAARRQGELDAQAQQRAREAEWLAARIGEVEREITALRHSLPEPERIIVGETTIAVANPERARQAATAGVAGFAATWLVCLGLIARRPGRARPDTAGALEQLVTPTSDSPRA